MSVGRGQFFLHARFGHMVFFVCEEKSAAGSENKENKIAFSFFTTLFVHAIKSNAEYKQYLEVIVDPTRHST